MPSRGTLRSSLPYSACFAYQDPTATAAPGSTATIGAMSAELAQAIRSSFWVASADFQALPLSRTPLGYIPNHGAPDDDYAWSARYFMRFSGPYLMCCAR